MKHMPYQKREIYQLLPNQDIKLLQDFKARRDVIIKIDESLIMDLVKNSKSLSNKIKIINLEKRLNQITKKYYYLDEKVAKIEKKSKLNNKKNIKINNQYLKYLKVALNTCRILYIGICMFAIISMLLILYEINGYIEGTLDPNGSVFRKIIRTFLLQPLRI